MAKKSILSLFFTDSEQVSESETRQSASEDSPVAPELNPEPDAKVMAILENALEEANQPGFDYFEFRTSLKSMAGAISEENIRMQAALASASSMKVTPADLIESATSYLEVIDNEDRKFTEALSDQTDNIKLMKSQRASAEKAIVMKSETIAKLTQEIGESQAQITKYTQDIANVEASIEKGRQTFAQASKVVISEIKSDISKLKQHLKGGYSGRSR